MDNFNALFWSTGHWKCCATLVTFTHLHTHSYTDGRCSICSDRALPNQSTPRYFYAQPFTHNDTPMNQQLGAILVSSTCPRILQSAAWGSGDHLISTDSSKPKWMTSFVLLMPISSWTLKLPLSVFFLSQVNGHLMCFFPPFFCMWKILKVKKVTPEATTGSSSLPQKTLFLKHLL